MKKIVLKNPEDNIVEIDPVVFRSRENIFSIQDNIIRVLVPINKAGNINEYIWKLFFSLSTGSLGHNTFFEKRVAITNALEQNWEVFIVGENELVEFLINRK
jgi:hypothetical protein